MGQLPGEGMTCEACTKSATNPRIGLYQFTCLSCCARLVLSAHPDKRQASAMLGAIARFKGAPGRAEILASVAQCLTKPQSAAPKQSTE